MKNTIQKLLLFIVLFAYKSIEAQVNISIIMPPPYSPYINDFMANNNGYIICTNTTNTPQNFYLKATLFGPNNIFVQTKADYKPSQDNTINLGPFATNSLGKSYFEQAFSANSLNTSNLDMSQFLQGILPEGNYTFCVSAFDYVSDQPVSTQACVNMLITYGNTPILINPSCGMSSTVTIPYPIFTWTPIPNISVGSDIVYDLYIVKVMENMSAMDAMTQAYQNNVGNPLIKLNLTQANYNYHPSDIAFENNAEYAWMVVVKDRANQMVFTNQGKSNICSFRYSQIGQANNDPNDPGNIAPPINESNIICSCTSPLPQGNIKTNFTLNNGDMFKMGEFDITIISISKQAGNDGKFSGIGKVNMPLINSNFIPIRIGFNDITINNQNMAMSGGARALQKSNVNFIPAGESPNPKTVPFTPNDAMNLDNYFNSNADQLISNAKNSINSIGFELPLGLDEGIGGMNNMIIAITDLRITPRKAFFNAAAALNMPDANPSVIALGANNVCISPNNICGEAILYLAQDIDITLGGAGKFTLKGLQPQVNASLDSGTYIIFNKDGFEWLRIQSQYELPTAHVTKPDNSPAKATITTLCKSWSNWMASVSFDAMKIVGVEDFIFAPSIGYYDHSLTINIPNGLPAYYKNVEPSANDNTWQGFFLNQLQVQLPPLIKERGSNTPISIGITNMIIDNQGISVDIGASNVLSISDGDINGWAYSLDQIGVRFLKNSFHSGLLNGKIALPITDRGTQSQLLYSCALTYADPLNPNDINSNNKKFQFNFTVTPKNDLNIPLWIARLNIDNSSLITINNANPQNKFVAMADLTGALSIVTDLGPIKNVQLGEVAFQHMILGTQEPYFQPGNLTVSIGSPNHSAAGFNIGIKNVNLIGLGIEFTVFMEITQNAGKKLGGDCTLGIVGKFTSNGPEFDKAYLKEINVDADLSCLHVKGKIIFYNDDPTYGNGFAGALSAIFPSVGLEIAARAQFGSVNNYDYWFVDAMVKLPSPGIPMFPSTSLFGFGGGAYYHMSQDLTQISDPTQFKNGINGNASEASAVPVGTSSSGFGYLPNNNIGLGLKATIFFGLSAKETFNADVTMELNFTNDGGINQFLLNGNGRFISNAEMTTGVVTGTVDILYDAPNKIFQLSAIFNGDIEVVSFTAPIHIYTHDRGNNQIDWHIILGRPAQYGNPITVSIAGFDLFKAYFEVGNYQIDPLPPIPQWILNMIPGMGNLNEQTSQRMNQGGIPGIIMGASFGFDYSGTFLIIKGELHAGVGFDLMLKRFNTDCDGNQVPYSQAIGMDGWYARGQIWAGIKASLSLYVDFGIFEGEIELVGIGAAAVLAGGGPNPTWLKGAVTGYFSVLNGLIEGSATFKFSIGKMCDPAQGDPLASIKLLSDIHPLIDKDENTNNPKCTVIQETMVNPAIATNLKLNNEFQIFDDNGKCHIYKFTQNEINTSVTGLNVNNNYTKYLDADQFGLFLYSPSLLPRNTDITFTVTARLLECKTVSFVEVNDGISVQNGVPTPITKKIYSCSGNWELAKYKTGVIFEEVKKVSFKTNNGIDSLREKDIMFTYPHKGQRYFNYSNITKPSIAAIKQIKLSDFAPPRGFENDVLNIPRMFVRFVPMAVSNNQINFPTTEKLQVEVVKHQNDAKADYLGDIYNNVFLPVSQYTSFDFNYPSYINTPNQVYTVQLILEWNNSIQSTNMSNLKITDTSSHQMAIKYNGQILSNNYGNTLKINSRQINENKLKLAANQKLIYQFTFKTSQYTKADDKVKALKMLEGYYYCNPDSFYVSQSQLNPANILQLQALIKSKCQYSNVNNIMPMPVPSIIAYPKQITFTGPEKYDIFDVYGYRKHIEIAPGIIKEVKLPGYVSFQNAYVRLVLDSFKNNLVNVLRNYNIVLPSTFNSNIIGNASLATYTTIPSFENAYIYNSNAGGSNGPLSSQQIGMMMNNMMFSNKVIRYHMQFTYTSGSGIMTTENQFLNNIYLNSRWLVDPAPDQFQSSISLMSKLSSESSSFNSGLSSAIGQQSGLNLNFNISGTNQNIISGAVNR